VTSVKEFLATNGCKLVSVMVTWQWKTEIKQRKSYWHICCAIDIIPSVVLGAAYRGCDLLGQIAESVNAGINSELTADRQSNAEELQTAGMSSLRRSLSLVTLSDLVPSMVAPACSAADGQVGSRIITDVDQSLHPVSYSSTEEQHSQDNDSRRRYSFEAAESSFTDIPPLSQRLHLQPQSDSTSHREPATHELPSSAGTSQCDKVQRNQSSQRTANSDSMALPSKRRLALMMRVAHVLSDDDDVFLDCMKSSPDSDCKASSLQPTQADHIISEDDNRSADTSPFHRLDARVAENAVESDVIQQFNTALHIVDKDELSKPVSRDSHSELCEATKRSGELDNTGHSAVNNAVLSSFDELSSVTDQQNEQLMWSPRHCGNFCIETSIMNTPGLDVNGNDDSALQINEFSVSSNENRASFDRETTGSDGEKTDMSCLLFDEPVTSEDKSILPSYGHNNSSVTEIGASRCNDSDHSVIVID